MIQLQNAEWSTAFKSGGMQVFALTVRKQKQHLQASLLDNTQTQNKSQVKWEPNGRNVIFFSVRFM